MCLCAQKKYLFGFSVYEYVKGLIYMLLNNVISYTDTINFGKKNKKKSVGRRGYSMDERYLRHEINTKAVEYGINDIYTGVKLSSRSGPHQSSVEHIIAFDKKKTGRLPKNFNINGLENFFPVGKEGNMDRGDKDFREVVKEDPKVLTRLLDEMPKLEKYDSGIINGKQWRKDLTNTICTVLRGICSDIKTKEIKFL